ncbi:HK97 family phage prohead protease [Vibrio parahaemolyticus]
MTIKNLYLQIKSFEDIDNEEGVFTAYANVKNVVDKARDCTVDGCFNSSIERADKLGRMPKMLLQHDFKQVCGVWLEMVEDEKGLLVKGKLALNTTIGKETYELLKLGALDALSIGYIVKKSHYDKNTNITFLQDVDIREISIVTFPCNEDSLVESVKSEDIERIISNVSAIEEDVIAEIEEEKQIPLELVQKLDNLVINFALTKLLK